MKPHSPDTSLDAHRAQVEVWRRLGPEGRLNLAVSMSEELFELTRAGIAARHPEYSASDVRFAELRRRLGDDLFTRAFPTAPMLAP